MRKYSAISTVFVLLIVLSLSLSARSFCWESYFSDANLSCCYSKFVCFPIEQQSIYSLYRNSKKSFSIKYPSTWHHNEGYSQADVVFIEPERGGNFMSNANIIVKYGKTLPDKESNKNFIVKSMRQYFPNYTVRSNEYVTICGVKAIKLVSSMTMEGFPIVQTQYFLVKNGKSFTITFSVATNRYDLEKVKINTMINSLSIY